MIWREIRLRYFPGLILVLAMAGIGVLWRGMSLSQGVVGIADGIRSLVSSPQPGVLQQVLVAPYQMVRAGDPIAILQPLDARADLDLLQAEVQIARLQLEPAPGQQNAMDYEQIHLDWLRQKQELATARVNLEMAQNILRRHGTLYKENLISADVYELSLKNRDLYLTEVIEKSNVVSEVAMRLKDVHPFQQGDADESFVSAAQLAAALDAKRSLVTTNWQPTVLRAPISGMVGTVHRQAGEHVVDGEPLVTVLAPRSGQIIAYLRQPYFLDPEVGMPVRVSTRTGKAFSFDSSVSQVGAQVEVITNALAFVRQGALVDAGLPVVISVPDDVHIRPGEIVDVTLIANGKDPASPSTEVKSGVASLPNSK